MLWKRTFQANLRLAGTLGSSNSLRYQPTDERFSVVSAAFQLLGTVVAVQPASERCAKKRWASPRNASSSRKYQRPPSR